MASTMKICGGCRRHVWGAESRCPFCDTALPTIESPLRAVRMVMVGLTIALGSVACGPGLMNDSTPAAGSSTGVDPVLTSTTASSDAPLGTSTGAVAGSSTGTDGIDGSNDDSLDGGCSFYGGCPSDGSTVAFECDLFAQDCPPGEKCMPWDNTGGSGWNGTRCSPIANDPAQVDEPCTVEGSASSGIDDCDIGLMCFGVDSKTNQGTCTPMCMGNIDEPTCDDPDDLCVIANDGAIVLCMHECDPVIQDCLDGEGCYPVPDLEAFVCAPNYGPEATQGTECAYINSCNAGQVCVDNGLFDACGGAGCCATVCDLFAAEPDLPCDAIEPGLVCQPYYEAPPPGYDHVGICLPPA